DGGVMSIANRLIRLVKADLHSILDLLEDPGVVLRQAIRDMQEEIEANEKMLEDIAKRRACFVKERESISSASAQTQDQLELCLREGKDELARVAVRKKLSLSKRAALVERHAANLAKQHDELAKQLSGRKEQLARVREKSELFEEMEASSQAKCESASDQDLAVSEREIELSLLEEKARFQASSAG
ncbi:MAG: hypothetical protein DCC75_10060, partial [Proteobacteria bacterium]